MLHNMSGRLDTQHIQGTLSAFTNSATDLQVELVLSWRSSSKRRMTCPQSSFNLLLAAVMEAVITRVRREFQARILKIFKKLKERIISSGSVIIRKVNTV